MGLRSPPMAAQARWRGQAEWSAVAEFAQIQLRRAHNVGSLNSSIAELATFRHFSRAIPLQETGRLFARYSLRGHRRSTLLLSARSERTINLAVGSVA